VTRLVDSLRYIVGPGDTFTVRFFETQLDPLVCGVSVEGVVSASTMGVVSVAGSTLADAKSALRDRLSKVFPAASFDVSLTSVRFVRAQVVGAVRRPGSYVVSATALAGEVIDMAGGLLPGASRRRISLRSERKEVSVDLVRAMRLGEIDANPAMYLGEIINVPPLMDSGALIYVSGAVNFPGPVEWTGVDNMRDLVLVAGGFTPLADTTQVWIISGDSNSIGGVAVPPVTDQRPTAGSRIIALTLNQVASPADVTIAGLVRRPGRYRWSEELTIHGFIDLAGGATPDAYLPGVTVFNQPSLPASDFTLIRELYPDDSLVVEDTVITNLLSSQASLRAIQTFDFETKLPTNSPLLPGDSVVVPRFEGLVTVIGQVRRPGRLPFTEDKSTAGKTPLEFINQAGGVTAWADISRAGIYRPRTGIHIPIDAVERALDGDVIIVPRKR